MQVLNKFPTDTSRFKLIVSDFDGTLAGSDHKISDKSVKAVKKWIASGRHFSIATGRQFLMIEDECKKLGLTDPVIVRAEAEVVDPVTEEVLHSEYIDKNEVEIIKRMLDESNLFLYSIEIDKYIYSNFEFELSYPKITFKELEDFKTKKIAKFHVKPKDPDSIDAEEVIKQIGLQIDDVHAMATHNKTFGKGWDITSVRATKLYGIVKVMERLNIEREDIVGVGDSYNDFPLLEAAGFKVAMGNAREELKGIADVIVPHHDEDGVAYLIEKLLENSKS